MRRKRAAHFIRGDARRPLLPAAKRAALPSFVAVIAALGCASEPTIAPEPLRIEMTAPARSLPAADPHEELPPPVVEEPAPPPLHAPAPAPAKKKWVPKHPTYIQPSQSTPPFPGEMDSVAPKILSLRRA